MNALMAERECRGGETRREAKVISIDEMWTYVGSRRKGNRDSEWTWTAMVEEADRGR